MNETPVFDEVFKSTVFTTLPSDYTDRYTPEVARLEGQQNGQAKMLEVVIAMIDEEQKPTKQLLEFRERLVSYEFE